MTNEEMIDAKIKLFYLEPKLFIRQLLLTIKELEEKIKALERITF